MAKHTSIWLGIAFLAIFTEFGIVGCSSSGGADGPKTVNFMIESAPTNLDPRIGTDAQSEHLHGLIFDSLVARDAQMNIAPDLADRWETPDPLTYVFHLKSGVKFHNGKNLTAADVKFTFDSILSGAVQSPKLGAYGDVKSVETPDDATVVFHLREPYASFLWNLSRPGIGIVSSGSGKEEAQHPVGTGPFRFVSMEQDDEIVLERNPEYFGNRSEAVRDQPLSLVPVRAHSEVSSEPAGEIERVRFRIVPDAIVRALELRKGSADLSSIDSLTPDMNVAIAKEPGIIVDDQPGTQLAYIAFNFDDPILAHREVRQALAYATDRATLIKYLLRGQAKQASSLLPPNHWAYEANVRQYGYDLERAGQLLDAAGFPKRADGVRFHLELKTSTDESTRLLATALVDQWKRAGVALDLRPLETATFFSDITRGSFQLYTFRWVGANNDPDIFQYVFSSQKVPPAGANRGHYRNATLDSLLNQERAEVDRDKRKTILSDVQKIVAEEEPYITLWYMDNVCVHRDRISSITIPPGGDYDFLAAAELH